MMITRELIKVEIDKIQDSYLEILYRIIKALINPPESVAQPAASWQAFIEATYGCLADEPIERGHQGQYEIREAMV